MVFTIVYVVWSLFADKGPDQRENSVGLTQRALVQHHMNGQPVMIGKYEFIRVHPKVPFP